MSTSRTYDTPTYVLSNAVLIPYFLEEDGPMAGGVAVAFRLALFLDTFFQETMDGEEGGRESRSLTEEKVDVYDYIATQMEDQLGMFGRDCVLRFICEMQRRPIGRWSVGGWMLSLIFTPLPQATTTTHAHDDLTISHDHPMPHHDNTHTLHDSMGPPHVQTTYSQDHTNRTDLLQNNYPYENTDITNDHTATSSDNKASSNDRKSPRTDKSTTPTDSTAPFNDQIAPFNDQIAPLNERKTPPHLHKTTPHFIDYLTAQILGSKEGDKCSDHYPSCPFSIFQYFELFGNVTSRD